MKGEDRIYIIALLFTFIFGIGAFAVLYSDTLSRQQTSRLQDILGLPDNFTERISSQSNLLGSMRLASLIDSGTAKGFIVENNGGLPLSGFTVGIGNAKYEPYASPGILLPGSRGAIIVDEGTWQKIIGAKSVTILTKRGVKIDIYIG